MIGFTPGTKSTCEGGPRFESGWILFFKAPPTNGAFYALPYLAYNDPKQGHSRRPFGSEGAVLFTPDLRALPPQDEACKKHMAVPLPTAA